MNDNPADPYKPLLEIRRQAERNRAEEEAMEMEMVAEERERLERQEDQLRRLLPCS
jgi:hypothetical protein